MKTVSVTMAEQGVQLFTKEKSPEKQIDDSNDDVNETNQSMKETQETETNEIDLLKP